MAPAGDAGRDAGARPGHPMRSSRASRSSSFRRDEYANGIERVLRAIAGCGTIKLGMLTTDLGDPAPPAAGAATSETKAGRSHSTHRAHLPGGQRRGRHGRGPTAGHDSARRLLVRATLRRVDALRHVARLRLIFLYASDADDCSSTDPVIYDAFGPFGPADGHVCYRVPESILVNEVVAANAIAAATRDPIGFGALLPFGR
jgi:hypothetical protein